MAPGSCNSAAGQSYGKHKPFGCCLGARSDSICWGSVSSRKLPGDAGLLWTGHGFSWGNTRRNAQREDWSLFPSRFPGKNVLPSIGLEVSDKSLQAVSDSCWVNASHILLGIPVLPVHSQFHITAASSGLIPILSMTPSRNGGRTELQQVIIT